MSSRSAPLLTAILCGAVCAADPPTPTDSIPWDSPQVRTAIEHGIEFLLQDQNADGSWGGAGGAVYTFSGDVWSNPETHRAWRVATTGLCCMALLEAGDSNETRAAAGRSVDYLLNNAVVKRPSEWDLMNSWAYIYGLDALATAYAHPLFAASSQRDEIARVAAQLIAKLSQYQTAAGGWTYLELDTPTPRRPTGGASFTTAAAVVALQNAAAQGFQVDEAMLRRALRAIERCRLPSGAYTYSIRAIPDPRHAEWIDRIKGSLARVPTCQVALLMGGRDIPVDDIRAGLDNLFRYHRFLDIARNRPTPHETYYYNSGDFYLFVHYY
ncbi:MAG: hypothetical protein IID39_03625, partial [Planctomycetes bacterium]|nr:hypothetical protein [Planctomycetota bacterium]